MAQSKTKLLILASRSGNNVKRKNNTITNTIYSYNNERLEQDWIRICIFRKWHNTSRLSLQFNRLL